MKRNLKNVNLISIQRGISSGALEGEHMEDSFSELWSATLSWCIAAHPSTSGSTFPLERRLIPCLFSLTSTPNKLWTFPRSARQLCFPPCTHLPARARTQIAFIIYWWLLSSGFLLGLRRFTDLLLTWTQWRCLDSTVDVQMMSLQSLQSYNNRCH